MYLGECLNAPLGRAATNAHENWSGAPVSAETLRKRELAQVLQLQIRYDKRRRARDKHDYVPPRVGDGLFETVESSTCSPEQAGFCPPRRNWVPSPASRQDCGVSHSHQHQPLYQTGLFLFPVLQGAEYRGNAQPVRHDFGDFDPSLAHQLQVQAEYNTILGELKASELEQSIECVEDELDALAEELRVRNEQLARECRRQGERAKMAVAELERLDLSGNPYRFF